MARLCMGESECRVAAVTWTMDLISLIVTLIVVGVLLWLVNSYIPMDSKIKRILNIVVVVAVVIWLLNGLGLMDSIRGIRVGR